jgi:DNA-binding MarR family transcriptional regulator
MMKDIIEITEEDPILRTFILFQQTARVVAKFQDTYMNKYTDLSDVKLIVLMAFFYNPNAVLTATELAKWTDTEIHNITTLVDRMKKDGLLEAERDKKDKRFLRITLTEKGRRALKDAMPTAQEVLGQLMSSVGTDDALTFEKVLKTIRLNAYTGLQNLAEKS